MPDAVVEVEHLSKHYPSVKAVDDISFEVLRGEVFALVGPNGAGKTTTVEILECLRSPTSGQVRLLGHDIATDEESIKKRIGVVPQDFKAFERLTVKEHLTLIQRIYGGGTDLRQTLDTFDLWDLRARRLGKLSGGQQRRVAIAMAVASDPELLFLDEPTTGLDPHARRETWSAIRGLKKLGKTVIITTHYMEEVEKLADRAAVIVKGKIIAMDTIDALIGEYGGGIKLVIKESDADTTVCALLRRFAGDDQVEEDQLGNVVGSFSSRYQVAQALVALYNDDEDRRVSVVEPDFDTVFLNLAGATIDAQGELL